VVRFKTPQTAETKVSRIFLSVKVPRMAGKIQLARPPDELLAKLKQHKAEIVALLQQEVDEAASAATSRPSWWPEPHPRIVREPPFGSDCVPTRYRAAWDVLLAQCPADAWKEEL
jgi:hypothetical protein